MRHLANVETSKDTAEEEEAPEEQEGGERQTGAATDTEANSDGLCVHVCGWAAMLDTGKLEAKAIKEGRVWGGDRVAPPDLLYVYM